MTSAPQAPAVTRTVALPAPAGEVWRHVSEPDRLAEWLGEDVDLDVTEGAAGRIGDRSVLVTEVDEERRLGMLWWSDGGESSSVEITLTPAGTGTEVTVVERLLTPAASMCATRLPRLCSALLARV